MVQARVFHIHDAPAPQANEMVMLAQPGIEARRGARVQGSADQAKGNKRAQDTMDRHPRDLRQASAHFAVKLFSRRMIGPLQDRFKDGAPLGRNRQAAFAMRGEEAVHSLCFVSRAHGSELYIFRK